jgi:hypothetical protein
MRTTDGQGKHHRIDVSLPSDTQESVIGPVMLGSEINLLAIVLGWALCPLDWQAHAVMRGLIIRWECGLPVRASIICEYATV